MKQLVTYLNLSSSLSFVFKHESVMHEKSPFMSTHTVMSNNEYKHDLAFVCN